VNGPDTWCYDALELPRVFASGLAAKTILRSLEVIETVFDDNPARHVTILLSRVPIEAYLATALQDDEVARYLRENRTPGQTTLLALESDPSIVSWTIDGVAPSAIPLEVPGDPAAGVLDETRGVPALLRAVVSPGAHVVRCGRVNAALYERTVEIRAGELVALTLDQRPLPTRSTT
jgi:hypothetical protein